jgi:LysR family nitrogen assimilation transcriptional regulator
VRRAAADPRGTVSVGLPQGDADPYGISLLAEVRKHHPGVRLELFEEISGNLPSSLHNGKLDMALLVNDADTQGLKASQVVDEQLYLIAPPGHAFGKFAALGDLADLRFAMPTAAHGCRAIVEDAMTRAGLKFPEPDISANSASVMLRAVESGLAFSVMPWDCVADRVERCLVTAVPIWPALTRRLYVCTSKETPLSPAARCVKDRLVEVVKARVSLR